MRRLFLVGLLTGASLASAAPEVRCAFDVGSGETKVLAAPVTMEKGTLRVGKAVVTKALPVPYKKTMKDEQLVEDTIVKGIAALKELKKECTDKGATAFAGVATSAFRQAKNGKTVLERLAKESGVPLRLLSGEEEGQLGFYAAAARVKTPAERLVVWDIGGGSQQLTARVADSSPFLTHSWDTGADGFRTTLATKFGRPDANPLGADGFRQATASAKGVADTVDGHTIMLRLLLQRTQPVVIGIGGVHADGIPSLLQEEKPATDEKVGANYYDIAKVKKAAEKFWDKKTDEIQVALPKNRYPANVVTNAALVVGFADSMGITRVHPLDVNLADGLIAAPAGADWK